MSDTVTVNAKALHDLLHALNGPGHYIRELQATREPASVFHNNPINVLIREFNEQVHAGEPK